MQVFKPKSHEYSVPFNGDPAVALSVARAALLALSFEILLDSETELQAEGPGMHSNQQPELVGASLLRFEVSSSQISVAAELGGVARLSTFVYLFPPILVVGLFVMGHFFDPSRSLLHVFWAVIWIGIAPLIGRSLERKTTRAIDRLVRAMAQAKSG